MIRRVALLFVLLLFCVTSAWPKFKEDEQRYLDEQFRAVLDQMQAMQNQIHTLNTQLQDLRQKQDQFGAAILRQQRKLDDLDQRVNTIYLGGEDHYSTLKTAIGQLRSETQASFNKLSPGLTQPSSAATQAPASVAAPAAPRVTVGYVTSVEGDNVLVDLGSAQGIQQGTHLALYKAADPNTRVGVLEVTQVLDGNSRARILTINSGVKPEFGDSVHLE